MGQIFGKLLYEMAKEGMASKVSRMPENGHKSCSTIERMNEAATA